MSELSNKNFNQSPRIRTVIAPPEHEQRVGYVPPYEAPEKKQISNKKAVAIGLGATAATIAIAAGAVFGISSAFADKDEPTKGPVAEAPVDPSDQGEVEAPSEGTENLFSHDIELPTEFEYYVYNEIDPLTMDRETLDSLASWYTQYRSDFEDRTYAVSGLPGDKVFDLTENSTTDEVLNDNMITLRMAANMTMGEQTTIDDENCGPLDVYGARVVVTSGFENPAASINQINFIVDHLSPNGQATCIDPITLLDYYATRTGQHIQSETVKPVTLSDGTVEDATVIEYYVGEDRNTLYSTSIHTRTVTNFDGTTSVRGLLGVSSVVS